MPCRNSNGFLDPKNLEPMNELELEKEKNFLLSKVLRLISFSPLEHLTREQANEIRKTIHIALQLAVQLTQQTKHENPNQKK